MGDNRGDPHTRTVQHEHWCQWLMETVEEEFIPPTFENEEEAREYDNDQETEKDSILGLMEITCHTRVETSPLSTEGNCLAQNTHENQC